MNKNQLFNPINGKPFFAVKKLSKEEMQEKLNSEEFRTRIRESRFIKNLIKIAKEKRQNTNE